MQDDFQFFVQNFIFEGWVGYSFWYQSFLRKKYKIKGKNEKRNIRAKEKEKNKSNKKEKEIKEKKIQIIEEKEKTRKDREVLT